MPNQYDDIKNECLQKWGEGRDERLDRFSSYFAEWINQLPQQYHSIVLTLIRDFDYYSHKQTNAGLRSLHESLISGASVSDENTVYAFIKTKDGETNSSIDYWTEYKTINKLNKYTCYEDLDAIEAESWEAIENIVFIDDFGGTGKSFLTEIKKCISRYRNKHVFYLTIGIMNNAIKKIESFCANNEIDIHLLSANRFDKAFSRGLFEDDRKAQEQIKEMSKMMGIPNYEIMGYKKTQATVAFYNNTPNNTLGFMRYDTDKYNSIFPRKDDKKPAWFVMQQQRKERKNANYSNKAKG